MAGTRDDSAPVEAHTSDGPLRGLHVLEALARMEQPASLLTIAGAAHLPKSMAYRTLRSLQEAGFVEHAGRSGYRLAGRSVALASLIGPRLSFLRTARPVLTRLAAAASEPVSLHLRSGAHRVLVLGVEPPGLSLRGAMIMGERAPLTSGCSGTSILAYLRDSEADEVIASRPPTEQRPATALLAKIRRDGYAVSFSSNHPGVNGIAAPVLDPEDRRPLGSVAIAGFQARLPEPALHRLSKPLMTACTDLAPRLARMLGSSSSERLSSLDVTIQSLLDSR